MLQPDPARRWSAEQVLMHAWVRGPEVGEAEMAAELQKMSRHAVGAPLPISTSYHVRSCSRAGMPTENPEGETPEVWLEKLRALPSGGAEGGGGDAQTVDMNVSSDDEDRF